MDDTLLVGRLTLMLLRSSIPLDSLPPDYGVILLPSTTVLSQKDAIKRLEVRATTTIAVRAQARGSNLIISIDTPTPGELEELRETVALFERGLRKGTAQIDSESVLRVVSATQQGFLIPIAVLEKWLATVTCPECPLLALGLPAPTDEPRVVGVVRIGRKSGKPLNARHE